MYTVPATDVEHHVQRSSGEVHKKIVGYTTRSGIKSGALLGGMYGTPMFPLIGTIIGALIGAIAGMVLGLINGLVLGNITMARFYPKTRLDQYRRVVLRSTCTTNLLGGCFLIYLSYITQDGWDHQNLLELVSSSAITWLIVVPTLIAVLVPLFWRNRYIKWYIANL